MADIPDIFLGMADIPDIFFLVNTRCWGPDYVAEKFRVPPHPPPPTPTTLGCGAADFWIDCLQSSHSVQTPFFLKVVVHVIIIVDNSLSFKNATIIHLFKRKGNPRL